MITIKGVRYLSDFEAKKAILDIGKRMFDRGFVAANDGNISCRVGPNALWTTPTGVSKGFMTQDMLVKVDLNGKVILGKGKPSSELKMHLRVYQENPEVMGVTHAHPPVATSFAIAGISLDKAILPEAVVQLGSVPIAHYATPGTQEVPDSIAPYCKTHNGVLLANHGALSWGKDIYQAYYRLESMEYYAQVLMYTGNIIGKANVLSCQQVDELINIRQKLGIQGGGIPPCTVQATNTSDVVTASPSSQAPVQAREQEQIRQGSVQAQVGQGPVQDVLSRQIVPPKQTSGPDNCGCTSAPPVSDAEKAKEEIIAEVVRRVTEKIAMKG